MTTMTILPTEPATGRIVARAARSTRVVRPIDRSRSDAGGPPTLRLVEPNEAPQVEGLAPRPAPIRRRRDIGAVRPAPCDRSYEGDLHGSRLTGRGRVVVAVVWLVLAAVAALAFVRPGLAADPAPEGTTTVVVEPGDTLWQLARSIDSSADPRATIDAIVELNALRSGADIAAGDVLVVPRTG
jgi:nucleoid-associated protein YgaU